MDIEKLKKLANNKIEAEDLTKQVRRKIKETTWEKQNLREGFTETFKPLISKFEEPGEESKKQNIFTQNKEMLKNQLALMEGVKDNQEAIKKLDSLDKMVKLLELEEEKKDEEEEEDEDEDEEEDEEEEEEKKDDQAQAPLPKQDKSPELKTTTAKFDISYFDKYLNNKEAQDILNSYDYYNLPSYYFDKDINTIEILLDRVNDDIGNQAKIINNTANINPDKEGYQIAKAKANKPQIKTKENIAIFNILSIYGKNITDLLVFKENSKSGSGIVFYKSPQELLKRFELLNGSLAAGNNGVLPEFIQIAHRLRDLGILSNNQLNTLLRKVI